MARTKSLGESLEEWRHGAKLTQREAARRVGVDQATWSRWERGVTVPEAGDLSRIVAAARGALTAKVLVEGAGVIREAG